MSQPPDPYQRQYNFTDHSIQLPNAPQPGNKLDLELNEVRESLNHTISRLNEIQRDDGKLRDSSIADDHLIPGPVGPQGPQGIQGIQGVQGVPGINGQDGLQGIQGIQGVVGPQGPQGDKYAGTTTTSLELSNGTKTFTTQTGLAWTSQQDMTIVYDNENHMHGAVTSYDAQTGVMVVEVSHHTGHGGPYSAWTINIEGAIGAMGPVGPMGPQGEPGIQGIQGIQGPIGPINPDGLTITEAAATYKTIAAADAELAGKANLEHTHQIADVSGLTSSLSAKANTIHTHALVDVVGLNSSLSTLATDINQRVKNVLNVTFDLSYAAGYLSILSGNNNNPADRALQTVNQLAVGTRSWFIQRPTQTGKIIFLGVQNADNKRQTKGPRSYVEFTHADFGVIAHGDLEYEDAGIVVSSFCSYAEITDAAGTPWSGYFVPTQTVANGTGGYEMINASAGSSPCYYPNGFVIEQGGQYPLQFSWSDSEGHQGMFEYGYVSYSSKVADGSGGFYYNDLSTTITAQSGQVFHADPGQCSGALELAFDGVDSYTTSDTRVSSPPEGTYLRSDSGTYVVNLCGSDYQVGTFSGDFYSDGSCGENFVGSQEFTPYGSYLTNCDGYNHYSDGSGGYYSESDGSGSSGGCSGETGYTSSGDLYVYISEISQDVVAGSYSSTEYYNEDCTTYWSQDDSWYSYGTELYNDGFTTYYADGSGGYYY